MNWFCHDSHDLFYRTPFGAVPCLTEITLRATINAYELQRLGEQGPGDIRSIILKTTFETPKGKKEEVFHLVPEAYEEGTKGVYRVVLRAPAYSGLLWYYFAIECAGGTYYYGNNTRLTGGPGQLTDQNPSGFQVTVHAPGMSTPDWFQKAVVYQVFVDRFFNGYEGMVLNPKKNSLLHAHWYNDPVYIRDIETGRVIRWDFFGGNLEGVRQKLPYLKNLGISAIYFNPIFEAPSNHKYDTADYHRIDPMYGTEELFQALCDEAEQMGIYVILDGVFSHTGSDSIYFNREGNYNSLGAYQSQASPFHVWYRFSRYPHEYDSWWGIETLPNVNELDPSYQDFILFNEDSVIQYWQRKGAKGWRLDVVDELPGVFIKNLRRVMKALDPDSVLVGEVWEDASNKISYNERREYLLGEELDSTMNYPFRRILLDFFLEKKDAREAHMDMMSLYENYPREHFFSALNLTGSHDVARILTELDENLPENLDAQRKSKIPQDRLRLFTLWQFAFPGVPSIYYGDEAGLEGGIDPENRKAFPWGRENKKLLEWFRTIIALRNHYDVLQTGAWETLHAEGHVYGFVRFIENGRDVFGQAKKDNMAAVFVNRDIDKSAVLSVDLSRWCEGSVVDPLEGYREVPLQEGRLELSLAPMEGRLFLRDRWASNLEDLRESGVLLHPTSLPSPFGVGGMGKEAYEFVDFLQESGQKLWQILPLNPPGFGYSPYQCFSAFAGNPMLIDLETLAREDVKLEGLESIKTPFSSQSQVEFFEVEQFKNELLRRAFEQFRNSGGENREDYRAFCAEHEQWLEEYALFMALKGHFRGVSWNQWEPAVAFRDPEALNGYRQDLEEEIAFQRFLQYIFFKQWIALKTYANEKGVRIVGDLPIFVAHDSSDVWTHPHLFQLDEKGSPGRVAGVPPDYFSETGQLWGNPHYRWDEMEKDGYRWWKDRFALLTRLVDIIRIDHFRGFESYWEVPAGEKTAVNGKWVKGPGEPFFRKIMEELGPVDVIAEDLGYITPEVEELKTRLDFPGMLVMQFVLKGEPGETLRLPLYKKNTILYTGTHDNDTMVGWYRQYVEPKWEQPAGNLAEISWHYIEMAMGSDARIVIFPLQDILGLESNARMNIPGTAEGNWNWRFSLEQLTQPLARKLCDLTRKYHR